MDDQTLNADPSQTTTTPAPDWITLARDAYEASSSYFDASIRQQIEADLRQAQGQHPVGSKYLADGARGRSKLFRPKTRATIRKNEAQAAQAFFSTNDVVAVSAEDDNDPVQQASAAVMGELLQYRLSKSIPWFLTLTGAYQDALTVGIVSSYQYWEYNERKKLDRPAIRLIPIENLRFDPGASWTDPVGTSPYLIELVPMYVAQVKSRMRAMDPRTGEAKWRELPEAVIMTATKSYGDTIRMQREGQRTDSKYQVQANNNFNIVWVHKNIIEVDEVDYCYYTLGPDHLLSEPVPLAQLYFHGKRPYVIGTAMVQTHKLYPDSTPRITRDVQAEINEVANQRIDNVKLAMNKRYFARRNKQVDLRSVTRNVPGSVTLMQDTDDVKVLEFNDVTASSYKEQEVLNLDFDDVAGAFSGASVQSNRKLNETVGGMQLLDASANQLSNYQLRTFVETWVEPVLRQIVLLEQYYETDETLIGLCGDAAKVAQRFGIDQITDDMLMAEFTLNVNVGMGATNPAEQVRQFISGMTSLRDILSDGSLMKLGLNIEEVIKELFGKLGYKDGGRFFDLEDVDPMVKQLQETVAQLQAALDAKIDPKLLDAQIRRIDAEIASMQVKDKVGEAEAVKKGSEAQFSSMQTAEVIAAVPAVAPIADELMRAAGYRPPVPAGIDPNFPQPGIADTALGIEPIKNKRTGISFMPGDGTATPAAGGSTTLAPVKPLDSNTGQRQGIETTRADSVGPGGGNGSVIAQAAMANGGLVGYRDEFGLIGVGTRKDVLSGSMLQRELSGGIFDRFGPAQQAAESGFADMDALQAQRNARVYSAAGIDPNSPFAQPDAYSLGSPPYIGYANGGLIAGPGTGTSDSVPALAGSTPVALSDGEYLIPAAVVDVVGADFFEQLIGQFHAPVAATGAPLVADVPPIPLENGDFVIPADVVAALGQDFFDALVAQYGATP